MLSNPPGYSFGFQGANTQSYLKTTCVTLRERGDRSTY